METRGGSGTRGLVVVALVLAACGGGTPAPKEATVPVGGAPVGSATTTPVLPATGQAPGGPARVCCESFGYGDRMVECCTKAVWTKADECRIPPGFVGGGKRVVDDAKCQGN
jgi:hypothetical protein